MMFVWAIVHQKIDPIVQAVVKDILEEDDDPWVKEWMKVQTKIGPVIDCQTRPDMVKILEQMPIDDVIAYKEDQSSMMVVPEPAKWFKLQPHVDDSAASRSLCRVRAGGLG